MLTPIRRSLQEHLRVCVIYFLSAAAFGYAAYIYLGPELHFDTLLAQMQWQSLLIPFVFFFVILSVAPALYLGSTALLFLRSAALCFCDCSRAARLAGRIVLIGWAVYLLSWFSFAVGLPGALGAVGLMLVFNVIHSYGAPIIFLCIATVATYYVRNRLALGASI